MLTLYLRIPAMFGDQFSADHLIKNDDGEEGSDIPVDRVALVMLDRATGWIAILPNSVKDRWAHRRRIQYFAGPTEKVASFYNDNAPELVAAARECKCRAATATTGLPQ